MLELLSLKSGAPKQINYHKVPRTKYRRVIRFVYAGSQIKDLFKPEPFYKMKFQNVQHKLIQDGKESQERPKVWSSMAIFKTGNGERGTGNGEI